MALVSRYIDAVDVPRSIDGQDGTDIVFYMLLRRFAARQFALSARRMISSCAHLGYYGSISSSRRRKRSYSPRSKIPRCQEPETEHITISHTTSLTRHFRSLRRASQSNTRTGIRMHDSQSRSKHRKCTLRCPAYTLYPLGPGPGQRTVALRPSELEQEKLPLNCHFWLRRSQH